MARFLVTGSAGFIGSHLVSRLLSDGDEVVAVDRRPMALPDAAARMGCGQLQFVQGDLLDLDLAPLVDGAEFIVHLAGQPGVRESWSGFSAYARDNIMVTQRLLEASRGRSPRKFVLASTSSVYGEAPMPAREDGPVLPISPYGASKMACESLCDLYGRTTGLRWLALRYFTVYGPRQRPDMAFTRWLKAAYTGDPVSIYGRGDQVRDFTYVADTVEATLRATRAAVSGLALNVGGGSQVSVQEALATIEQVTGRPLVREYLPPAPGDMPVTCAETTRLREATGFVPATPLADGLRRQFAWVTQKLAV